MVLFRFRKYGLAREIIGINELLLKDIIRYFEKGHAVRQRFNKAHQLLKKAIRLNKKKKLDASEVLGLSVNEIGALQEELQLTQKVLRAVLLKCEKTLSLIGEERLQQPIDMIENSRALIRRGKFEEAGKALTKIRKNIRGKILLNIRNLIFGGTYDEVRRMKQEITEKIKTSSKPKSTA